MAMSGIPPLTVRKRVTKEIVGNYTVITRPCIGSGTYGRVYEAKHNVTHKKVAVKEVSIADSYTENKFRSDMIQRELHILRQLKSHKNIIRIIDHVFEEDSCWIFMEFCNLGNLSAYLENNKTIDLVKKVRIISQSSSALAFMHRQTPAIIHRDLKLQNILMTFQNGEHVVKLTDFGLSNMFHDKNASLPGLFNQTRAIYMTPVFGSDFFMAPELFAKHDGKLQYDLSIDVFALGLVHMVILDYTEQYPVNYPVPRQYCIFHLLNI